MGGTNLTLHRADAAALPYVEALLEANDLPTADVRSKPDRFYVATVGGERVGIGGLEPCGTDGLLRSLVVEAEARGSGYGEAICRGIENEARERGIGALYLLTTTAAGFFAARGYDEIEWSGAPASVRRTTEFDELCPATATCMWKQLAE